MNPTSENDKSNNYILFYYLCMFFPSFVFSSLSVLVLEIYSLHYQKVITAFRSLVTHKSDMWRTHIQGKCLKTKFLGKYLHLSRISHVQYYIYSKKKIIIKFTCFIHFQIFSSPNTVFPNNTRNCHINLHFLLHIVMYIDPFSPPNVVEYTNIQRALLIFDTRKCHSKFKYPHTNCAHSITSYFFK